MPHMRLSVDIGGYAVRARRRPTARTGLVKMRHASRAHTQVEVHRAVGDVLEVVRELLGPRGLSRVMRSWAKPVMPGSTTRRCQYCGICSHSSSKNAGRIGRGPTTLMSPRSTFHSCGSSSRCVKRRRAPRRVTSLGAAGQLVAEVRAEPCLRVGPQRAELVHREDPSGAADPCAAVEHRPPRGERIAPPTAQERGQHEQRRGRRS